MGKGADEPVRRTAVVIGAGISGLAAARDLVAAGHEVIVLDAADRPGGKLRRAEVGGVAVDVGAEAMLNRRPEGIELAASLGLELIHPTTASSRIWTRDALRPLPRSLMGAPLDLGDLAASGVLSAAGLERARHEVSGHVRDGADVSVGDLVAAHFGDEVVDRIVEPLLGGVYAGHARLLSARAAVPQLVALAERGSILEHGASAPISGVPVFAGLTGGMTGLIDRLSADLDVRTGVTVREVARTYDGFRVLTGPTTHPVIHLVDLVVLATPAAASARLLDALAPVAAAELGAIDYASVAVVTLAIRAADAPDLAATAASGFLVPPVDRRTIKAATFSFTKWGWVRQAGRDANGEDVLLLRTSLGRIGDEIALQRTDEELVVASLADLRDAIGVRATPIDAHVQRWGGGLPQYAVGHLDRVARIREAVATVPGLAVCGAAYDGVGIAPCIASGRAAALAVGG